jgi:tetrahydromethanopterin S-methyltransferase subunit A
LHALKHLTAKRDLKIRYDEKNCTCRKRLLSENKGIDSLVRYVIANNIDTIIVCGKDVTGHSLLALYKNGIDDYGRIIGSHSPDPVLAVTKEEVTTFCNKVKLLDMIGETSMEKINQAVGSS